MCCELGVSARALVFLLIGFALTTAILLATPMDWRLRAPAMMYVFATVSRACRTLLAHRSLRFTRGGELQLCGASGWRTGCVRPGSFVMPWLVAIRWRPKGAWWDDTLLLLPDMAPAEEMRRLRVLLQWA
jgi:hypothetical protein